MKHNWLLLVKGKEPKRKNTDCSFILCHYFCCHLWYIKQNKYSYWGWFWGKGGGRGASINDVNLCKAGFTDVFLLTLLILFYFIDLNSIISFSFLVSIFFIVLAFAIELGLVNGQELYVADVTTPSSLTFKLNLGTSMDNS